MSTANLTRTETARRAELVGDLRQLVELDLTAAADPAVGTFGSRSTLRFSGVPGEHTWVDLIADGLGSAILNGVPLDVADYDGARLPIGPLAAENQLVVQAACRYSVTGEGLHRFRDPEDGNTYLYSHFEPTDSRRMFSCFEQPDLKGRFTFRVTAPADWQVLSNQPESGREPVGDDVATVSFAVSPPLSSYLTAVAAGPYHRVDDGWSTARQDGSSQQIELALLCRASMAQHLAAADILTVTKQGLDFYDREFGYPYPWGKYHQIFVPEYNIGAMENPGLVTFTEDYLPRGSATRPEREARANTILHEMAHMWFGDLVTPQWWDDLWLKESFADYMGTHVNSVATEFTDAWTPFAARRKAWAYLQDQLPTTHPIVATIDDVEAARQNFDGITYAKGASVLKQLVAYVGEPAFFAAARRYFAEHAFGNTRLPDLLAALTSECDRDLQAWSVQWLQTAGISELTPVLTRGADGRLTELVIEQRATDPTTGEPNLRPHRLVVGLYELVSGRLTRTERIELDVVGGRTPVPDAVGSDPALVLVNDDDLTYAKVRLAADALPTLRTHLSTIDSSLSRAIVTSALWNATRDALLPAADYLQLVGAQLRDEPDLGLLRGLIGNAQIAVERYLPAADRPAARAALLAAIRQRLDAAAAGSELQLLLARSFPAVAATVPAAAPQVRGLLAGSEGLTGLTIDPDLRWQLWQALAAVGSATEAELAAVLAQDNTMSGRTAHLQAVTSRTGRKDSDWARMTTDSSLTNDQLGAMITGFTQPLGAGERHDFVQPYFAMLIDIWRHRSQVMASMLAEDLFPGGDLRPGTAADGRDNLATSPADGVGPATPMGQHPVLAEAHGWLAAHRDAPNALRRIVIERTDELERALRAQQAGTASDAG
ncbi:aminopeptidase N [Nakamurella lactea]|uniref:aminopeptidase N n=1 Tax=Nakamurella lactea TaxID=459515 RepID=UPI0003F6B0AD|nr:aminopeptidase N [Nakamurella lactea]